ncbi:hypothetical protein THAOC_01149 [Thalassiosira oceanica]|uniref:Non-haem dioxygenase N-terminal domain-containing protein n=1 Tax=Thalassiosira oceanica TaxID=159749 RepID=K0THS1_THAOC|nr:hypothetical protein THAOC_01149 [Thalassiosira oceanica]|mmetsp:Transcript_15677/g.36095  ORF Transcript_15677/g.36095 Transcript_15677/m.36095 type:complete len:410 (-) Transcript_15677:60-1289(-)|eukprot:EJK77045.1 hypothetical protein THAOC_01149 [Thalassiosira oceanica]
MPIVCINYNDLVAAVNNNDDGPNPVGSVVAESISSAFGSDDSASLGIVAITNVPGLEEARMRLLPLGHRLASLDREALEEITVPESQYQCGWSHGREKLVGDRPDLAKGSFYANPICEDLLEVMMERRRYISDSRNKNDSIESALKWDECPHSELQDEDLVRLAKSCPGFYHPNVWPKDCLPELETAFTDCGKLIHQVGIMVANCCDRYVADICPGYKPQLERTLRHSKCCKGRLLHYFPAAETSDEPEEAFDSWCGWHNDHGSLTGLLPCLYVDNVTDEIVESPDPVAGLYIKSRNGDLVKATLPDGAIGFQIGETAQVQTGGVLQATPHAVKGLTGTASGVSRETFAVFMEPEYHSSMALPEGRTLEDTQCAGAEEWLPSSVRTLRSRWKPKMNFGEFSEATFAAFH